MNKPRFFKQGLASKIARVTFALSLYKREPNRFHYDDCRSKADELIQIAEEGWEYDFVFFHALPINPTKDAQVTCGCGTKGMLSNVVNGWGVIYLPTGTKYVCRDCAALLLEPLSFLQLAKRLLQQLNQAEAKHRAEVIQPAIDSEIRRIENEAQ